MSRCCWTFSRRCRC